MSSDFNFTVTSWFQGNVHVKPFKTQCPLPNLSDLGRIINLFNQKLFLGPPIFSDLPPSLNCSIRNAKENIYANVSVGGVWETPNNVVPYIPLKNRARHKYRPVVKFWVGSLAQNHRFFFLKKWKEYLSLWMKKYTYNWCQDLSFRRKVRPCKSC